MPHAGLPRARSRTATVVAVLLAGVLALPACSAERSERAAPSPSPSPETATPSASTTAPGTRLSRQWPLTGHPAAVPMPLRRAIVVKVENTSSSRPQVGLGQADLVVQQLVEGGLTRLAAFYYSGLPREVGPVRSMRASDIGIVKPANALLVASGGAPPTVERVRRADIPTATQGAAGYHRVDARRAPYDLFMRLKELVKVQAKGRPPQAYLPWGPAKALGRGKPAGRVDARFSGGTVNSWRFNGRRYRRSINHTDGADDFRPDAVLVLRVEVTDAGYRDPAGNPVPETILSGRGRATLFHHGRAFEGGWAKRAADSALRLSTRTGGPMPVPPGHIWIELVPNRGGDVRYRR